MVAYPVLAAGWRCRRLKKYGTGLPVLRRCDRAIGVKAESTILARRGGGLNGDRNGSSLAKVRPMWRTTCRIRARREGQTPTCQNGPCGWSRSGSFAYRSHWRASGTRFMASVKVGRLLN